MDFTFYMALSASTGWAFYDIRHKGQRILYELSMQEAMAHYGKRAHVEELHLGLQLSGYFWVEHTLTLRGINLNSRH